MSRAERSLCLPWRTNAYLSSSPFLPTTGFPLSDPPSPSLGPGPVGLVLARTPSVPLLPAGSSRVPIKHFRISVWVFHSPCFQAQRSYWSRRCPYYYPISIRGGDDPATAGTVRALAHRETRTPGATDQSGIRRPETPRSRTTWFPPRKWAVVRAAQKTWRGFALSHSCWRGQGNVILGLK